MRAALPRLEPMAMGMFQILALAAPKRHLDDLGSACHPEWWHPAADDALRPPYISIFLVLQHDVGQQHGPPDRKSASP